ncbi:MAG: rod shape-determining protein MreC [Rickettsiaceae bacterium]|nr:rod shape-determining protein MreC [Rickettsiaceae bacterium]
MSCYLLYFSTPRIVANSLLEASGKLLSVGALIYQETIYASKWAHGRLSYFKDLEAENLRLKIALAALNNTQQLTTRTQSENIELRKLLNVTQNISYNFVTARIISTALSPFTSSAIIQAGTNDGININNIVKGKEGLIGRITEVSANYATIMLINDHNSRIPVITGNSKVRGILTKQGDHLKMIYLKDGHNATNGEIIYTSGDGKIYPKGIAVAVIDNITNEGAFVQSIENFNDLEYAVVESKPVIYE